MDEEVDVNGPSSSKRARVDLNDSFYDSEEDELVSQACGLEKVASSKVLKESFINNHETPQTPKSTLGSTPRLYQLSNSATTLKGKPLVPLPRGTPSSAMADENDGTIIHTSKPFFRLATEVKELTQERDTLKGQALFLEQSLRGKKKENQEHLQKIAELTQKYTTALEEMRDIQRRADDEIVQLRTQLQFQSTPIDAEIRSVTNAYNVPKIKPRMSTSSHNKSFTSTLKPKPTTPRRDSASENTDIILIGDRSDYVSKEVQTDAFRVRDVITDMNILSKREKYGAILDTMIGATFINTDETISSEGGKQDSGVIRLKESMSSLVGVDNDEPSLNEFLDKGPAV